jgi:hypothetical protein
MPLSVYDSVVISAYRRFQARVPDPASDGYAFQSILSQLLLTISLCRISYYIVKRKSLQPRPPQIVVAADSLPGASQSSTAFRTSRANFRRVLPPRLQTLQEDEEETWLMYGRGPVFRHVPQENEIL